MTIARGVELPEAELAEICRRYEVRELSVFGSAARDEMRENSDVDFLVEFLPDAQTDLIGLAALTRELSDLLGRPVDLGVKSTLKPLIRDQALAQARVVYAA